MINTYKLFKLWAFYLDPERIHEYSMSLFKYTPQFASLLPRLNLDGNHYRLTDGHMKWNFPVGLAAGFDKNAQAIDFFNKVGFGSIEVGTVTPRPQIGNARPRIHRLKNIQSIRNSMGFPNQGMDQIAKNILSSKRDGILGVNLGKNKATSIENTPLDYQVLYEKFCNIADYLVINVSSPNTEGLRDFQNPVHLKAIFEALKDIREKSPRPLYLKIAPDLEKKDVYHLVDLAKEFKLSGIIATNTTIQHDFGPGGLSGKYIRPYALKVRKQVCEAAKEMKELSVIGVGAVESASDLIEFLKDGGSFMQIYTSFIYQGPQILLDIASGIDEHLKEVGANNLQEWVNSLN